MGYSIDVDWHEEFGKYPDKWINEGRHILDQSCKHYDKQKDDLPGEQGEYKICNVEYSGYCEQCGISEDDCEPMMNYTYPLVCDPSEEAIAKVVKNTCLTVMYNNDNGKYYLVLCGGGMDLSQQIGLAYLYTDGRIPKDLIEEISTQANLSVSGKDWRFLKESIIEELEINKACLNRSIEEWKNTKE